MNWHLHASARVEKETPGEGKRMVKSRRDASKTGDLMGNEEDVKTASPGAEIGRENKAPISMQVWVGKNRSLQRDMDGQ